MPWQQQQKNVEKQNLTIYANWITNFQYLLSYFTENGTYYSNEFGAGYEIIILDEENTYEFCVEADGAIYLNYIYEDDIGIFDLELSYNYNEFSPFVMFISISVQTLYVYGIDYDATYDFETSEFVYQFDESSWGIIIDEETIKDVTESKFHVLISFSIIYFEDVIGVPFQ